MASENDDGQKDSAVGTIVTVDTGKAKIDSGNEDSTMLLADRDQDPDEEPLQIENSGSGTPPRSPLRSALVEKVQKAMADRLFRVFVKVFVSAKPHSSDFVLYLRNELLVYEMCMLFLRFIAVGSASF